MIQHHVVVLFVDIFFPCRVPARRSYLNRRYHKKKLLVYYMELRVHIYKNIYTPKFTVKSCSLFHKWEHK